MTQLVTTAPAALPVKIQLAVAAWLDEHSTRPLTHRAYDAELRRFRAELQRVDLDLDGDYALVALVAQAYAAAGEVGAITHNKRLSIVSSFYKYAIRHNLLAPPNPIDLVKRRKRTPYARAQALDVGEVRALGRHRPRRRRRPGRLRPAQRRAGDRMHRGYSANC